MIEQASNPFNPGAGRSPALLAGRSSEQDKLKRAMAEIASPRVADSERLRGEPPQHLKIVGPRGVGKTTLLTWMQREAEPEEIVVVRWAHVRGKNSSNTYEALLDEFALELHTKTEGKTSFLKAVMERAQRKPQQTRFRKIMTEHLKLHPVLLLLDEVMHYEKDLLAEILRESHELSSEGWPLALILAGTPALDIHLRDLDATFAQRSQDLFINELSDEAVREALRDPFEQRGVKMTDEALELMAGWTGNYPYFTQIVGEMVWDSKKERTKIDVALVEEAKPAIQKEYGYFYASLYEDIRNDGLLRYTHQLVTMIEEPDSSLSPEEAVARLIAENDGLDEERANEIFLQLLDHGLIWLEGHRRVGKGLSSFFTYFKAQYKAR